jgi:CO/xanthine dehydrogenase Mo-binding subunit
VRAGDRVPGPYQFPHLRVASYGVYTNSTPAGSYRAIGGPQASWACESQMDIIAAKLGLDPLWLRLHNLVAPGEEVRRGKRPLEGDLATGLRRVAQAIGWDNYQPSSPRPRSRRGIGIACAVTNAGASPTSTAIARLHADGSATLLVGTTEIGWRSSRRWCRCRGCPWCAMAGVSRRTVSCADPSPRPYASKGPKPQRPAAPHRPGAGRAC